MSYPIMLYPPPRRVGNEEEILARVVLKFSVDVVQYARELEERVAAARHNAIMRARERRQERRQSFVTRRSRRSPLAAELVKKGLYK